MSDLPEINTPDFQRNLHRNLARLREEVRVHHHEFKGSPRFSLLRYDDVRAALRDARFGAVRIPGEVLDSLERSDHADLANLARIARNILILKEPPDHTRLRRLLKHVFTRRAVARYRPRIERIVAELLDALDGRSELELIEEFAVPLPMIVIGELLGVAPEDRRHLKRWSDDFAPMIDRTLNQEGLLAGAAAATAFSNYFGELVAERRREPRDDLISDLAGLADSGDALSEWELIATCTLLMVAGHETTTNLIGNGMFSLLCNRDQLERLRQEPEHIETAVEELLRFESPIQRVVRHLHEDVEVGGTRILKGSLGDLVLASANRDPAHFPEPDRLDIAREDNRHLAFGSGTHLCLGASLARLEGQIAIRSLLERLPSARLATEHVEWRPGSFLRALCALPLRL